MDNLVQRLSQDAWVVDIGAGPGSFDYRSTRAHVLSVDLAFDDVGRHKDGSVKAPADRLPLADGVVDVVVCNHSLEHFPNPGRALGEVDRVLKPGGFCWIAIPDGHSLDDRLYRFLFSGGGHLSRFSLESFLRILGSATELNLVSFKDLYSGFVYLAPPDRDRLKYYPQPARAFFSVGPARGVRLLARWLAHLTRRLDRRLGTHTSRYGWGFVLQKSPLGGEIRRMPRYVNVCVGCGTGHPTETLVPERGRLGLVSSYRCPSCGTKNLFVGWSDQVERAGKI
jgi:SAM-dependent methyltransferase